jgi:hypothetical protein
MNKHDDEILLDIPEKILAKIPETVVVMLSGRQCRLINWVFTDFLEATKMFPEMPSDLLITCRSILTFARLRAENSEDSNTPFPVTMAVFQAHFIAFAVTWESQGRSGKRNSGLTGRK